jgi:uncharacterized protein (TIGR04255 family)
MSTEGSRLPDFRKPPVVEVALSVQFEPLASFRVAHFGLLWKDFQARFPKTEEHPALSPVTEKFGVRSIPGPMLNVGVGFGAPQLRCWFLNEKGTELLQVQRDRFIYNWRKAADDSEYPRYKTLRAKFAEEIRTFAGFLERERIGELRSNQCELTYVNHIIAGNGWESHADLEKIVTVWRPHSSEEFSSRLESATFEARYLIVRDADNPIGRAYVTFTPFTAVDKPIYAAQILARGAPLGEGIDGAFGFLDTAHEWIVRAFTAITTKHMHEIWERE